MCFFRPPLIKDIKNKKEREVDKEVCLDLENCP
jgi:hypothetical protein